MYVGVGPKPALASITQLLQKTVATEYDVSSKWASVRNKQNAPNRDLHMPGYEVPYFLHGGTARRKIWAGKRVGGNRH